MGKSTLNKIAATVLVSSHLAVLVVHARAHSQLHIAVGTWQGVFIALVMFIGPLLAVVLLRTRLQRTGLILLLASMAGSLAFGLSYHFLFAGADNALGMNRGHWQSVFRTTAVLLAVIELGAVASLIGSLQRQSLPANRS